MKSGPSLAIAVEGRLILASALSLIAVLAIGAAFIAELGATARLGVVALVAAVFVQSLLALRRQPRHLVLRADGTVLLDGFSAPHRLVARRYGPLLVLSVTGPSGTKHAVLIGPLLGRSLRRRLSALSGAS